MKNHEFIARASTIGDLMTKGKSKGIEWGDTSLAVIRKAVLSNKYGIEESFGSKHTEKGTLNEAEGLQMYLKTIRVENPKDAVKQRLINNFVTGEPDYIHDEIVVDIKNSWTASSFPWWDDSIKNKSYIFQLQTYLWLTGLKKARLVYTLTTTPEHIRKQEIKRLFYKLLDKKENQIKSEEEIQILAENMINKEMVFDHIPIENRVKIFDLNRDDALIISIQNRVDHARDKYDELYNKI